MKNFIPKFKEYYSNSGKFDKNNLMFLCIEKDMNKVENKESTKKKMEAMGRLATIFYVVKKKLPSC